MIDTKKFYINGAWVAPISDREMEVIDPPQMNLWSALLPLELKKI